MHTLTLSGLDVAAEDIALPERPIVVGRNPESDVVLADPQVGWHHLRLTPPPDGCLLEDLGSTNGTWVNGQPIDRIMIRNGERISIDPYSVRCRIVASAPSPSEASEDTLSGQPVARIPTATLAEAEPRAFIRRYRRPAPDTLWLLFTIDAAVRRYSRTRARARPSSAATSW